MNYSLYDLYNNYQFRYNIEFEMLIWQPINNTFIKGLGYPLIYPTHKTKGLGIKGKILWSGVIH